MKPCLVSLLCLGCTFTDGDPWGVAELSLEARWAPPESRLETGRLKTSSGYLIELERVAVAFDALNLVGASAGAADFDPADPPEGYSLCHNGHCHHESGALVAYEDIAIEAAGGSEWVQPTEGGLVELSGTATEVGLGACPSADCALPRGELIAAGVRLSRVVLSGTAFGEGLPEAGHPLDFDLAVNLRPQTPLAEALDQDTPLGVRVALRFELPPSLFDGLDPSAEDAAAQVAAKLALEAEIQAAVSRFE